MTFLSNYIRHLAYGMRYLAASYDREKYKPGYKGKFVIGLHDALKAGKHWDVRIQMPLKEGGTTYRSFVNKKRQIPSGDTKIFMPETEDHTPQQAFFTGTIPEGEYGAGIVKIYDKGTYELLDVEGDKKYVMDFQGEKLKGQYALVKYQNGFLWVKVKEKKASVVDYPRPRLCPDIWEEYQGPSKMKAEVRNLLLTNFEQACLNGGLNYFNWLEGLYLGGSLATYTYRNDSDIDIEILYNSNELTKYPEFGGLSEEKLKDKLQDVFNGINKEKLPGSSHGYSYMVLLEGEKPISDGVYDLIGDKWIRGPYDLPDDFDPDKSFASARDIALEFCKNIDILVGRIYRVVQDLKEVEEYSRMYGGMKSKRVMLRGLLKELCLEINAWHEFVRGMPRDAVEKEKPLYPSLKIGPNWEISNLVFKYMSRYGYNYPVHLILDQLKTDPYIGLVKDFIPD